MKSPAKKFLRILFAMAVLALIARLAVAYELYSFNAGRNPVQSPPASTDMATYMELARKISAGEFKEAFYYQPFYYAVFLPFIRLISGGALWAMIICQAMLGAATVYLTGLGAGRMGGRRCGYVAAGILVFSGILIAYTPYHIIATLQAFWVALLFYMTISSMERPAPHRWLLTGLAAGCGILTRGNIWFFVPGMLLAALYSGFKANRPPGQSGKSAASGQLKKFIPAVILVTFIILPQIPFAWRNTLAYGKLTGPSTAAEAVLALGNTPEAPPGGRNPEHLAGPMEYPPTYEVWMNSRDKISVPARILDWFRREPLAFAELMFRKCLLFWDNREIPNNVSYLQICGQSVLIKVFGLVETGFIISAAIAGMLLLLPGIFRHKKRLMLYYFVFAYWGATAIFYILSRFRAPVIPLLAIFAALAVEWALKRRRQPMKKIIVPLAGAASAGLFICYASFDLYRVYAEPQIMRIVRPDGVAVQISDREDMYLDNGPITFGGWRLMEIAPGTAVDKRFRIMKNGGKTARITIPLWTESSENAVIKVNGQHEYLSFEQPGIKYFTFSIPFPEDHTVRLQGVSGNIFCLLDTQRDYSRTAVGAKTPGGELVCRIYCTR